MTIGSLIGIGDDIPFPVGFWVSFCEACYLFLAIAAVSLVCFLVSFLQTRI